jgi:hypothetical protein
VLATSGFDAVVAQRPQATVLRRTSDGHPDIQGLWNSTAGSASVSVERVTDPATTGGMGANTTIIVDPADGRIPYQPWARKRKEAIFKTFLNPTLETLDPQVLGWPSGVPRLNYRTGPIQFLQTRGQVVILFENQHEFRVITLDGRPPLDSRIKLWMGSSRGRWEGDTLVVEVDNNHGTPWLSIAGDFHTDEFRVTERWRLAGPDRLEYRAILTDPNVYTRPWTIAFALTRDTLPGNELMEFAAVEGERWVRDALSRPDGK